jgi:hypothetical protein
MWGRNALSFGAIALLLYVSVANASWLVNSPTGAATKIAAAPSKGAQCFDTMGLLGAAAKAEGPVVLNAEPAGNCGGVADHLPALTDHRVIVRMDSGPSTLAAFDKVKRPIDERYGFFGDSAAVTAIRARQPNAWAWTWAEARKCQRDYSIWGWLGTMPESCAGKTMLVSLDQQWQMPGWPRRAMKRFAESGTKVILAAALDKDGGPIGISAVAHMENVPVDYTGMLWIDDIDMISRLRME